MNAESKPVAPKVPSPAPPGDAVPVAQAHFELHRHYCVVVPAPFASEYLAAGFRATETGDKRPACVVIGELRIGDEQFVVLAREISADAAQTEPFSTISDLLTPRELQIALLVARGKYNKQIAHEIKVSEWTVSSHLRRVFAKLGARTRAEMVARVLQNVC